MFWPVLATVAIIYVCNATLAMRQMRNFSTTYTLLRKRGKVAIGKQKNALSRAPSSCSCSTIGTVSSRAVV